MSMNHKPLISIPPVLEDYDEILKKYALNLENLPLIKWKSKHWERDINLDNTLTYLRQPPANATLKPERDPFTGAITGWKEIVLNQKNPCTDLGMSRPPLPAHLATRGNAMQLPFWPAGFLEETQEKKAEISATEQIQTTGSHDDEPGYFLGEELLVAPDGGYSFEEDGYTPITSEKQGGGEDNFKEPAQKEDHHIEFGNIDVNDLVNAEDHLKDLWTDTEDTVTPEQRVTKITTVSESQSTVEDELLESSVMESVNDIHEPPVLNITQVVNKTKMATEWAETLDVSQPVEDFETLIPNMAHKYPFELDIFQKQAILKLEQQAHVFVAAHTSAGKTAVAEYAIALSQRHCTRTVYTSPIKALSNQKYHDFKKIFGDVGLMTGDLQINQTASCLVMTTEILRSMLYCGSDVTRDLEFVIFDEVHYINNTERGHVWEEVLILLPAHVGIVMLSATVPNTLEFADWVGRTKQRKVYVISTPRRPVPLCHYLYTGSGGKSKNERFMIMDQEGKFLLKGYNDAVAAKESRLSEFKKSFGPKGGKINPKQEATMWTAFIDHLRSKDKLPVIAFTLSRNKCDQNAEALMSMDLTTGKEKSRIHMFFQRCLQRLKQPDRQLPQVLRMQRVLEHGIGVHHSGILPMLKEIVEMLFQAGLVKILFATETFAMGVNMPARTVVFNEVRKYDGLEWRPLAPAEFIQMAGRAGRRGLDPTGTVVILCKEGVPELGQLREMMLGTPTKLSSQFRLTYSMILSLLRVATVSVEGMMQRSFREFDQQTQAGTHRKQLAALEEQYRHMCSQPLPVHLQPLVTFYEKAAEYIELRGDLMPVILEQPKVSRELVPGRVLLVSVGPHINQPALLLNCKGPRATPYKVLVLDTANEDKSDTNGVEKTDNWYNMLSLSQGYGCTGTDTPTLRHTILHAAHNNILQLSKVTWKYDVELIIRDWEKRQMARFRDAPVGATCLQAVQELAQLSHSIRTGALTLEYVPLMQNLPITSGELLDSLSRMSNLKTELESQKKSTDIANFEKEFSVVYERMELERKRDKLRRLLSYESMVLYPDYQRRLQVLRELRYIDTHHRVALKGRVACEMGTNELIITELVFRNTLTDLAPAEIAALLSCLVFQARTQAEHDLTPKLEAGVKAITIVDDDLRSLENKYRVGQDDHVAAGDRLNFGLVKVVYEWARDKPFSEIMDLTDVQEGIIVRCIQQLHEVLMDVRDAAKIIGDPSLQAKMLEASAAIKRDIVFAASLYTTQKENVTI